jgi:hypothetical protein
MLVVVSFLVLTVVLTTPVVCVAGTAIGGEFRECHSAVGLPATIGVPLLFVALAAAFGALFYIDRHE